MNKKTVIILIILVILVAAIFLFSPKEPQFANIYLGGKIIRAEVVKTPKEMTTGLSKYDDLAEDQGMLFLFPLKMKHGFWMKDMKFAIDIIWLDDDRIIDISSDLPPEDQKNLTVYYPQEPVNKVLEVKAGFSEKNNLKINDQIIIR